MRIVRGEPDERFQVLYQRYYWRMVRYYVRAFRVSEEDAEDLAQEAFLRFHRSMKDYRGEAEWAFFETIGRNVALNHVRAGRTIKRNGVTVDIDDADAIGREPAIAAPDYAEREQQALRRKLLHQAIAELPPAQRQCMQLWLDGFQYDEIAKALRTTIDAVKSRLRDAKKHLRARLGPDAALPEDES